MFTLQKLNVVKVVDSEIKRDRLMKMGFVEIQVPQSSSGDADYKSMDYKDLKALATEKGINTYKMKKEDIVEALVQLEE
ncbi:Rho termination factor N-terminal domain-containing protein [Desulforamulus aeronauticus]|uniref:Rho termination factor, N-terminal domain n=1 Tax=Desulforamulus aeronauticus DSM 10349 TaxID=1121421 RepID=A0A1M6SBQ0_9FIRM|nr:Rho termination factor N-terminal domain-containing protein [Desulforamulus aeronauticus]SHK42202.1 Rho termination factor, N-terminal domain [Desulforamulus aeronauticus DSM 10349]